MAKINPIIILGLAGLGIYLYTSKKSSATSSTIPPKQGELKPSQQWWFMIYDCKSIEILNKPAFQKEISKTTDELISQEKITKQNIFKLNAIDLAKKGIKKFNENCANRNPNDMSIDEKMIFLFLSSMIFEEFRRVIAIQYDPNKEYKELITEDCPPMEAPMDFTKCKYVYDAFSPEYLQWIKTLNDYKRDIIHYLGLDYMQEQVIDAWKKLKTTNKYP